MSVEVRLDAAQLERLLRQRGGRAERDVRRRTRRVARIAAREAPGRMGRDVSWTVETGPSGLPQGVIACDHPAVHYVLNGTRAHLIRPRRRKALRFEVGGRVVFARLVRHPGTRANDFMFRALLIGR